MVWSFNRACVLCRSPPVETPPHGTVIPEAPAAAIPSQTAHRLTILYSNYVTRHQMDFYYRRLQAGFRTIHGDVSDMGLIVENKVVMTSSHVCIYTGRQCICRINRDAVSVRNLYLELHSCRYDLVTWLRRRQAGEYNNFSYEATATPWNSGNEWIGDSSNVTPILIII